MRNMNSMPKQRKADRQRRQRPPFRRDQRLDVDRTGAVARHRDEGAIPDEIKTAEQTDNVADPFQHPGHANGQGAQDDVDANMLALTEQPGRGQQGHQIENVLGEFIAHRDAAGADVARQDIGADHDGHDEEQQARHKHQVSSRRSYHLDSRAMTGLTWTKRCPLFFEKKSLIFGPCSGLCLMIPSQPA